ncbi:MAG: NAD(+) synthase [Bacteroidaceae bacterium]
MIHDYLRVAAATPTVHLADVNANVKEIKSLIKQANVQQADVIVFPELCLTGYSCGDLFLNEQLLKSAQDGLQEIAQFTASNTKSVSSLVAHETSQATGITVIVGLPMVFKDGIYNCAAIINGGKIINIVPKRFLPNYNEFYERRWFRSINEQDVTNPVLNADSLFTIRDITFGIEICEDLWTPIPPSSRLALQGAHVIFNLSATTSVIGKHSYLRNLVKQQSARLLAGYVYTSAGFGESTTDVVYPGTSMIVENGTVLAECVPFDFDNQLLIADIDVAAIKHDRLQNGTFGQAYAQFTKELNKEMLVVNRFKLESPLDKKSISEKKNQNKENKRIPLLHSYSPTPFVPSNPETMNDRCEEIINIQAYALATRMSHIHCENVVIGISGGLDSTLALLVAIRTFDLLKIDRRGIEGITMPGFGTTDRTYNNAIKLMQQLNITIREISISEASRQHYSMIGHNEKKHDVVYENVQARERTQILMDIANQVNGLVIGTGDMSELALGWATYNGDHMSMYAVNVGVPKTLVKHLVIWTAKNQFEGETRAILYDIVDTPISPELLPATSEGKIKQKTEDLVGPYELHDFFLYYFLRFGFAPSKIFVLACHAFRADTQEIAPSASKAYTNETISKWLHTFIYRFFQQQYKRSCIPDGPKIGSVSLSPRGDWRMPSDASSNIWLKELDEYLQK